MGVVNELKQKEAGEALGNELKNLRLAHQLTQLEVAKKSTENGTPVTDVHISRIEKGARLPSQELLNSLLKIYKANKDTSSDLEEKRKEARGSTLSSSSYQQRLVNLEKELQEIKKMLKNLVNQKGKK